MPSIQSVVLDGEPVDLAKVLTGPFRTLEVAGQSMRLTVLKPGTIIRKGKMITIKVAETIG